MSTLYLDKVVRSVWPSVVLICQLLVMENWKFIRSPPGGSPAVYCHVRQHAKITTSCSLHRLYRNIYLSWALWYSHSQSSYTVQLTLPPCKSALPLSFDPALISHTRFSLIKVFSSIWKWEPGVLDYGWKSQQEGRFFYKMGLGKCLVERSTDTVGYECLQLCLRSHTMT